MSTTDDVGSKTQIPAGVWQVDPGASELGFGARAMFGLVPVKGTFGEFDGTLTVGEDGAAHGELHIQAATLDTRNAKRDTHLRSADFFDVENHPVVTFELTGLRAGPTVDGVLRIRENALPITAPATISAGAADGVKITTELDVDRAAAGVGWSKLGMIKGKAHLRAAIALSRQS